MFGWLNRKPGTLAIDQGGLRLLQPFALAPRETVLDAALRAGIDFPFSCKVGGCATCKCQLLSGKVRELTDKAYLLSKEEMQQGMILGCQSIPLDDVCVRLPEPPRHIGGTLLRQTRLTHDISEVFVQLEQPLHYRPGQYSLLRPASHALPARCYSFAHACPPQGTCELSFFVRALPEGRLSRWLVEDRALQQRVELSPSQGDFHLRPGHQPLLCIAGGSGLAPLIALLEGMLAEGAASRDVHLLMGARSQADLFYLEQIETLRQRWGGRFAFVPVLSEEPAGSDWQGLRGWVSEAITADCASHAQGYLCGPPAMIDRCISRMTALGMPADAIFFDRFSDQSTSTP